ncbi:MAG: hypothetical protein Q9160_005218 [Pyrenula sp. 1 TL-2023]
MATSPSTTSTRNQNEGSNQLSTPRIDSWGHEVINVFVGRRRKLFVVHQKLICQASKFFERAINESFSKSGTKDIYLPEDDVEFFDVFIHGLYRNELLPKMLFYAIDSDYDPGWKVGLLYYYPMLDRLIVDPSLKIEAINSFMKTLIHHGSLKLSISVAQSILTGVLGEDPLRQLIPDHVAFDCLLYLDGAKQMDEFCVGLSRLKMPKRLPSGASPSDMQAIFFAVFSVEDNWDIASIERYQIGYLKQPAE